MAAAWAVAVGDRVTYQPFGGGGTRTVIITEWDPMIKNGEPGFLGEIVAGGGEEPGTEVWGYDRQIITVHQGGTK